MHILVTSALYKLGFVTVEFELLYQHPFANLGAALHKQGLSQLDVISEYTTKHWAWTEGVVP